MLAIEYNILICYNTYSYYKLPSETNILLEIQRFSNLHNCD
jgi:hypothetical protein